MGKRLAKRVLIVGWDAADWKIIDPLLAQGRMASLRSLIDGGVRSDLSSLDPKLSPLLWTSIATGKTADRHAILNFVEPDPAGGGLRLSCSTTRRTKALWNILTQAGMRTNVVAWYASHPAEPISGSVISNVFQDGAPPRPADSWPLPQGAVHPAGLAGAAAKKRRHPREARAEDLRALLPRLASMKGADPRIDLLKRLLAQSASVQGVGRMLLESGGPWDCSMVFFETIDVVGHHFMQYYPPRMAHVPERDFEDYRHVMPGVYELQDELLGRLVASAGPDTTVIVLSDHGFHSDHLRPRVQAAVDDPHAAMDATWHRPHGMLVMAGPGIRSGAPPHAPGLLDIAPTVLTLLGLPIGSDMDGRVLHEALDPAAQVERIPSWDDAPGQAGMHPAELRVDPFETRDAMKQLVDLGYLATPDEGGDPLALCDRETRFNLGVVYMTTGRPQQGAEVFERLNAEAPGERRFATNLAHCWYALGRHDEAVAILDGLVAQFPDSGEAVLMRSAIMLARGDAAGAAQALERSLALNPDRVEVLGALGDAYTRQARWEDASRVLERASSLDPHSPQVAHRCALLELARRRFEHAAEHALTALERRHLFPEAHHTLGVALAWGGAHAHAIRSFQVALSMQPGMATAHRFLAALHEHLGDVSSARPHRESAERLEATRAGSPALPPPVDPLGPEAWAASHRK